MYIYISYISSYIYQYMIWHTILSDILSGIRSEILSDILYDILSSSYFDILLPYILAFSSGMCSGPGVPHSIRSWRHGVRVQAFLSSRCGSKCSKCSQCSKRGGGEAGGRQNEEERGRRGRRKKEGVAPAPLLKSRDPHQVGGKNHGVEHGWRV